MDSRITLTSFDGVDDTAILAAESTVAVEETDTLIRLQPKSQLEKRMDAIEAAGPGGKTAEKLVSPSGESWAEMLDGSGIWFGENESRWAYLSKLNGGFNLGNLGTAQIKLDGISRSIGISNFQNCINIGATEHDIELRHSSGTCLLVDGGAKVSFDPDQFAMASDSSHGSLSIQLVNGGFKIRVSNCTLEAKPDGLYYNGTKIGG